MKDNFEFVQSTPLETNLEYPGLRKAEDVWVEMIEGAKIRIEAGQFYINTVEGQPMEQVLQALVNAGKRGVKIRIVVDKMMLNFYKTGAELLKKSKNIQLRSIDQGALTGGIMHAKYIVVDSEDIFIGSQNFDWLSLTNVYELGIRYKSKGAAAHYLKVFDRDWELCKKGKIIKDNKKAVKKFYKSVFKNEKFEIMPVFSPPATSPGDVVQELPEIVKLTETAKNSIFATVMEYSCKSAYHPDLYYDDIDRAFRKAAARGVQIKLLVSDWCNKVPAINYLKALSVIPNIEIKIMSIPRLKSGYMPFSRVTHCKYMVVDKARCWIGSSNWEPDYFFNSRNCSAVIEGFAPTAELRKMFLNHWTSDCVEFIDVNKQYRFPQITD